MTKLRGVDDAFMAEIEAREGGAGLKGAGGSGTSGGMEARLAKLEAQMEHALDDLRKLAPLPERTAKIEARLDALPDKDWVGTKMRNWVGGMGAFVGLLVVASRFIGH